MRSFWKGMLTGGIMGALAGLMLAPLAGDETRRKVKATGDVVRRGAQRLWRRARQESEEVMNRPQQ